MLNETGTAFLVDPAGSAPEALSKDEFTNVRNYLDIMRNEEAVELAGAIHWLFYLAVKSTQHKPDMDNQTIVGHLVHHYLSDIDNGDCGGILTNRLGRELEIISDSESEILRSTLATVRAGGWFPRWLAIQCGIRADANQHPDDRFASPLRVAGSLVDDVKEFEASLETARDFARMRPDLLFPAPTEPAATLEPAASEQTIQPATSKPAKAPRARKPRKKAARA